MLQLGVGLWGGGDILTGMTFVLRFGLPVRFRGSSETLLVGIMG